MHYSTGSIRSARSERLCRKQAELLVPNQSATQSDAARIGSFAGRQIPDKLSRHQRVPSDRLLHLGKDLSSRAECGWRVLRSARCLRMMPQLSLPKEAVVLPRVPEGRWL